MPYRIFRGPDTRAAVEHVRSVEAGWISYPATDRSRQPPLTPLVSSCSWSLKSGRTVSASGLCSLCQRAPSSMMAAALKG